jgi:riboflavin transporter FmnP
LNLLINGTDTAFVGEFANFLMGCAFVLPAAIWYRLKKSRTAALLGMALGTIALTVVGTLVNYFVLIPMYSVLYNLPIDVIVGMGTAINPAITNLPMLVVLCVAPFNLIKGVIISALTFVLYKRVSPLLKL